MYHYTTPQLAIIIAVPTVTILLLWTLAIFYKNRKQWQPYDICIVAILTQSVLRNISVIGYTILTILNQANEFSSEYCSGGIWLFNSIHTFQASTLSTLSVVGLYVIKLIRKQKEIKQYLSRMHLVYHLFCLTTLCACVGVAAILARRDFTSTNFEYNSPKNTTYSTLDSCQLMPYELDIKYNIFILSLHALLAFVSILCFLGMLFQYYKYRCNKFQYLKKSTSDLSDLSLGAAASTVSQKNYYDSYHKPENAYVVNKQEVFGKEPWNSDTSNISTSVSSTNSRRPCLIRQKTETKSAGMESIMPVLIVCYLFNHLPVVVVCVFPWLASPWTTGAGAALWLGLAQDALLPVAMGLVDGRFNSWVSRTYRCSRSGRKTKQDKPPHGLDGKFRPFSSTGQTLEVPPIVNQIRTRSLAPQQLSQAITQSDHKFPITNGSLYTSIDGRLPIIHNYRRHKGLRSPVHSISMGLHSTYVKRQELNQLPPLNYPQPPPPDDSFMSLPLDYTSLASTETKSNLELNKLEIRPQIKPRLISASQNSLSELSIIENELRKCRLTSSQNDVNLIQRDIIKFRQNPEIYEKQEKSSTNESSDEEYNYSLDEFNKNYDTISSQSCNSITTEANCDFDFFTQENSKSPTLSSITNNSYIMCLNSQTPTKPQPTPIMRSFKPFCSEEDGKKIRRSNSKLSLDKLDCYIRANDNQGTYIIRSNSFRSNPNLSETTTDLYKRNYKFENPKISVLSSDNLSGPVYGDNKDLCGHNYGGSVPDFKKVFVTEFI